VLFRSTRTLAQSLGAEKHKLIEAELAAHTHTYGHDTSNVIQSGSNTAKFGAGSDNASGSNGGDTAHNNMQPSLVYNYIIKCQ
jgi:microcystin-dependent protein